MSSMIERVGKAILDEGRNFGALAHRLDGENALERRLARAAIEAMREPDDAFMEQIHLRSYDGRFCKSGETYPVYRNFLRSFVDAALKGRG